MEQLLMHVYICKSDITGVSPNSCEHPPCLYVHASLLCMCFSRLLLNRFYAAKQEEGKKKVCLLYCCYGRQTFSWE